MYFHIWPIIMQKLMLVNIRVHHYNAVLVMLHKVTPSFKWNFAMTLHSDIKNKFLEVRKCTSVIHIWAKYLYWGRNNKVVVQMLLSYCGVPPALHDAVVDPGEEYGSPPLIFGWGKLILCFGNFFKAPHPPPLPPLPEGLDRSLWC